MKKTRFHAGMAALLLLALALMSCGNATNYGGPPGTSGGLSISPSGVSYDITSTSQSWSYFGGDVTYFVATGGKPPYYWYQSSPAFGSFDQLDEGNDGVYRRIKYTTFGFSGSGDSTTSDVITVIDQAGASTSVTIGIEITVEETTS